MRNLKKKVMVLNNFASPYISEAIIFLKDYDPRFDTGAIREAERIINEYIKKNDPSEKSVQPGKRAVKIAALFAAMIICFAAGYFFNK